MKEKYIRAGWKLLLIAVAVTVMEKLVVDKYVVKPLTQPASPLAVVWTPEVL